MMWGLGILAHQSLIKNKENVKEIVLAKHRVTIKKIAVEMGMSYRSWEAIFTVFNIKRVAAKFVSIILKTFGTCFNINSIT